MRTIKFRGKRQSDGAWIYGYYNQEVDGSVGIILPNQDEYTVEPASVGQLIAIDKNGREVYEGDMVERIAPNPDWDADDFDAEKSFPMVATFEDYRAIIDEEIILVRGQ